MQLVPTEDPTKLKQGDKLKVQLFQEGKPMSDIPVIMDVVNDLGNTVRTDADGFAVVEIRNDGRNIIGVETSKPRKGYADKATSDSYFATLSFISAAK